MSEFKFLIGDIVRVQGLFDDFDQTEDPQGIVFHVDDGGDIHVAWFLTRKTVWGEKTPFLELWGEKTSFIRLWDEDTKVTLLKRATYTEVIHG